MISEELLHFIWQYKLLKSNEFTTVNGTKVKILTPGQLNTDEGPDFFNAKIKIAGVTLAGNIEIHVRSSDWMRHGHQNNASYNTIILHVVYEYDKSIEQNKLFNVEIIELKALIEKSLIIKYKNLITSKNAIACSAQINKVNQLKLQAWLQRMLIERLELKTEYVKHLFEFSNKNYSETLYLLLARNFGFKVNAEPFELLAKHLPLQILLKHHDNLFQTEALLFGVAGFLNQSYKDKYVLRLQNEFEFLKSKYALKSIHVSVWKFLRLRPANFPTIRLSQLALLIHNAPDFFSQPLNYSKHGDLEKIIRIKPDNYWSNHYKLDGKEVKTLSAPGKQTVQNISLNTMVPFLFFYGKQTGDYKHTEASIDIFSMMDFELNHKTKLFIKAGLKYKTASDSQALLNLYDNYCKKKACLKCAVAADIFSN